MLCVQVVVHCSQCFQTVWKGFDRQGLLFCHKSGLVKGFEFFLPRRLAELPLNTLPTVAC